jgi:maltose O-acetyltransferase
MGNFGPGTGVQTGCRILNGRRVNLGARVVINFGCLLDGRRYSINIGDDVSIGPEATILTLGHDPQSADFAIIGGDVRIETRAWIGYRAIIMPAAGAVVTRDVAQFAVVAGSPAKVIGERRQDLTYHLSYQPWLM